MSPKKRGDKVGELEIYNLKDGSRKSSIERGEFHLGRIREKSRRNSSISNTKVMGLGSQNPSDMDSNEDYVITP